MCIIFLTKYNECALIIDIIHQDIRLNNLILKEWLLEKLSWTHFFLFKFLLSEKLSWTGFSNLNFYKCSSRLAWQAPLSPAMLLSCYRCILQSTCHVYVSLFILASNLTKEWVFQNNLWSYSLPIWQIYCTVYDAYFTQEMCILLVWHCRNYPWLDVQYRTSKTRKNV